MTKLQAFEQAYMEEHVKPLPHFSPGDTITVNMNVKEGERQRVQAFKGVVIAKRRPKSLNFSFIVRKVAHGESVDWTFQGCSPMIHSIKVERRGDVRRAKLNYLKNRTGRSARIKEKLVKKS